MKPISVLLVDDSPTFLRAVALLIHFECGNKVEIVGTATDGQQALVKAKELSPHIILLDLCMPQFTGLDLIPQMRAAHPGIGLIVVSLMDAHFYQEAARAAGADEFVSKSKLESDLAPSIRRVAKACEARRLVKSATAIAAQEAQG